MKVGAKTMTVDNQWLCDSPPTYTAFDNGRTLFGYVTNTVTIEAKGVVAILRQMIRKLQRRHVLGCPS